MSRTVTNGNRHVVTTESQHEALATAPDLCRVPGEAAEQPFPNWVKSALLKRGRTTSVLIDQAPVWTTAGELGPPSEPAHAGTDGGVSSHTYRGVATPTSYSRDLYLEGNAAVRAFDTTRQNDGNTVGQVLPSELSAMLRALLGYGDEECLRYAAAAGAPFIAQE